MHPLQTETGCPVTDWLDDSYYERLRTLSRRHWAWLWLKRNAAYQEQCKMNFKMSKASDPHRGLIVQDDMNRHFSAGYLYIRIVGVMAIQMPDWSGSRDGTRPRSQSMPSKYPCLIPMPSTSPVMNWRLMCWRIAWAGKLSCSQTTHVRFSYRSDKARVARAPSASMLLCQGSRPWKRRHKAWRGSPPSIGWGGFPRRFFDPKAEPRNGHAHCGHMMVSWPAPANAT